MSVAIMETSSLIHYLEIIDREISIEGMEQKASICHVFKRHIPNFIEDLRELNEYRKKYGKLDIEDGEVIPGSAKEAHSIPIQLHEPRHKAMLMRRIPD